MTPRPSVGHWVAYVGPFPFPEGAASSRRVRGVARAIAATGRPVTVVSSFDGPPERRELEGNPHVHHLSTGDLSTRKRALKVWRLLVTGGRSTRRWIESQQTLPEAVVVYGGSLPYHLAFRRWTRRRGISLIHDIVEWYDPRHLPAGRFGPFSASSMLEHRFFHRRADGVIAISTGLQNYYSNQGLPTVLVPACTDMRERTKLMRRRDKCPTSVRLLYFGNPGQKDDLRTIVEAAGQVAGIELAVAGPSAHEVQDLAHRSSAGKIVALGRLTSDDIKWELQRSDFTVFLRSTIRSNELGFPTKLAESFENGIPVIANLTSDVGDYLQDGVSGVVVAGPTKPDLVAALRKARDMSTEDLAGMRNAAAATGLALNWSNFTPALDRLFSRSEKAEPLTRRLKLLLISPLPPPTGGIARWTQRVLRDFADHPTIEIDAVSSALKTRRSYQLSAPMRFIAGLDTTARVLKGLITHICVNRPDVVHLNTSGSAGLARDIVVLSVLRVLRVPTLLHFRFGRIPDVVASSNWEYRAMRLAARLSSACVALDRPTLDSLNASVKTPVFLLPNYSKAPARLSSAPRESDRVLFIGSVTKMKGVEDLLEAWASLESSWSLDIVGLSDPMYLRSLKEQFGTSRRVQFYGEADSSEVETFYLNAALLVLPSHTEGFPNVVVEAMAHGLPIIATDVGALPEMLSAGAGVIVPPRDPDQLRNALRELMGNGDRREATGKIARERFEQKYERSVVMDLYVKLWRKVAAKEVGVKNL